MGIHGALVIDKPAQITSHDAVVAVRRLLGEKRIGHLGTLDPFATGVLVLLIGQATRLARFYREREKTYRGIIRFGYATDTMDRTGRPVSADTNPVLDQDAVRRSFSDFIGSYEQRPPIFSAKKVSGVPAHRLARKGKTVDLARVPVHIHRLDLLWLEGPRAGFEARVSSGTYIRSLVNDLGERLGIGAHVEELRRTSVGEFGEQQSISLAQLEERLRAGASAIITMEELLAEFPAVALNDSEAARVAHGNDIDLQSESDRVRLLNPAAQLIGIAERVAGSQFHPVVVVADRLAGAEVRPEAATPQDREARVS